MGIPLRKFFYYKPINKFARTVFGPFRNNLLEKLKIPINGTVKVIFEIDSH